MHSGESPVFGYSEYHHVSKQCQHVHISFPQSYCKNVDEITWIPGKCNHVYSAGLDPQIEVWVGHCRPLHPELAVGRFILRN